jgi:hypothetical protein
MRPVSVADKFQIYMPRGIIREYFGIIFTSKIAHERTQNTDLRKDII